MDNEKQAEENGRVTAIRYPEIGEFYYDMKYKTIDWRSEFGEEISMMPEHWEMLVKIIPKMMKRLGVRD